jgi:ribosomal protein L29
MAKKEKISEKSDKEILDLLTESRAKLRDERFAAAGSRAKNPNAKRILRRDIARALTEQGRRAKASGTAK